MGLDLSGAKVSMKFAQNVICQLFPNIKWSGYSMRRAAKIDDNHKQIVAAFKKFGCSVLDIHAIPNCADIVVGKNFKCAIVEIKDGNKSASQRELTIGEKRFRDGWQGAYFVVEDLSDVIAVVKALEK